MYAFALTVVAVLAHMLLSMDLRSLCGGGGAVGSSGTVYRFNANQVMQNLLKSEENQTQLDLRRAQARVPTYILSVMYLYYRCGRILPTGIYADGYVT